MAAVRAAIAWLDMHEYEVWAEYLVMTGQHRYQEFVAALRDQRWLSAVEYDKLVVALRDHFIDRGLDCPLAYRDVPADPRQAS